MGEHRVGQGKVDEGEEGPDGGEDEEVELRDGGFEGVSGGVGDDWLGGRVLARGLLFALRWGGWVDV